jgi:hypothetical protein
MLSGLGAVWQSFLGFAVYDVLGKIRIPYPALTSLLRERHFSKRNNCVIPEIRSYRTDTRVRIAGDFRLSHRITNERSTFAVFSSMKNRVIIQAPPQPMLLLSRFEDRSGEFQAFGFDPIALFSGTLLELRVVESA